MDSDIAKFQLPINLIGDHQSEIGDRKSAMSWPRLMRL
jgi:hypothetical protein